MPGIPESARIVRDDAVIGRTSGSMFDLGKLLPSQALFAFNNSVLSAYAGGWGTGKSVALCVKTLMLCAATPNYSAMIGRLHASDLRDTTLAIWNQVVPQTWIKQKNKAEGNYILRNNSTVLARHIHDPVRGRQHIASMNVAAIGVDQAEEISEDDFRRLIARRPMQRELKRYFYFTLNPAGHNWLWRRFYDKATVKRGHPHQMLKDWDWIHLKKGSVAVAVPTLENTPQCGGYLPDGYYEMLRAEYPPEWVARYLDCSFEDFEGKVYPAYSLDSIHNIERIEIPDDWQFGIGIDVGGSVPWAVVRVAFDGAGRAVVYDEFYKANAGIREVANWIQRDPHWSRALIVIDYENRPVMTELQQFGVICQPARKHKLANVARVNTWMRRHEAIPHILTRRLVPGGAPRLYITTNCTNTRREHDQRLWKPSDRGENIPDDQNDHTCDALEYIMAAAPAADTFLKSDKLAKLRQVDPGSAHFWEVCKKKEQRESDPGLVELTDSEASRLEETDSVNDAFLDSWE